MRAVGVRELREKTSQILKSVNETGQIVEVTHHGKVMARLIPPPQTSSPKEIKQALERAHDLMKRLGERVAEQTDSSTLMQEERRW